MQSKNFIIFLIIILLSTACTIGLTSVKDKKKDLNASVSGNVHAQKSKSSGEKTQTYTPGEVLVKFQQGTEKDVIKAIQKKLHLTLIHTVSSPYLFLMKINDDTSVEEMPEKLLGFKEVLYAEPNYNKVN